MCLWPCWDVVWLAKTTTDLAAVWRAGRPLIPSLFNVHHKWEQTPKCKDVGLYGRKFKHVDNEHTCSHLTHMGRRNTKKKACDYEQPLTVTSATTGPQCVREIRAITNSGASTYKNANSVASASPCKLLEQKHLQLISKQQNKKQKNKKQEVC